MTSPLPERIAEAVDGFEDEAGDAIELKDFTRDELHRLFEEGLDEPSFRGDQLFTWLYNHRAEAFEEMTNLSKDLRARLQDQARISPLEFNGAHESADGTTKLTFKCDGGSVVESVFIPSDGRNTLCISSQVGCAMGCTFCYTAKMGLQRNLTTAEIVDQVVQARRKMTEEHGRIGNIVFMGMGEPLYNVDNVIRFIDILLDEQGLNFSRRKVTVSTSGVVPAIERLGEETDVQLAISLNATTDETRSKIMPVNDRWGIDELMETLRNYPLSNRERITFEYVLIKGVNDSLDDARRLMELTADIPSKINLIPFNPHPKTPFETPSEETMHAFQKFLVDHNVGVYRRRTRGRDEMAACGQLGEPGDGDEPPHVKKRLEKFRSQKIGRR